MSFIMLMKMRRKIKMLVRRLEEHSLKKSAKLTVLITTKGIMLKSVKMLVLM